MGESYIQSQLELLKLLPSSTNGEIFTGEKTAREIIDSLVSWIGLSVFQNPSSKFLDIYTKSGIFLLLLYNTLMKTLSCVIPDESKRSAHILNNMLYGVAPSTETVLVSRKTLYRDRSTVGNIKHIPGYKTSKNRKDIISRELGDMKFDVVIGNPPYNRGMDLDFVKLGYDISTKYICMITPAKWQTADADQRISSNISYGEFRRQLVPHMSHVCFYPCCKDMFDILQVDGVSYFLMDKEKHATAVVQNVSKYFPELNGKEVRDITKRQSLVNIGNSLVEYLGDYTRFQFSNTFGKARYQVWMNTQTPGGSLSTVTSRRPTLFVGAGEIEDISSGVQFEHSPSSMLAFESDKIEECNSFLSWIGTRFTQFFLFINQSKLTGNLTDDCFRFVPAPTVLNEQGNRIPGKFDHIYTDQELYKTFNLPQKYIDVIEVIIKERKQ